MPIGLHSDKVKVLMKCMKSTGKNVTTFPVPTQSPHFMSTINAQLGFEIDLSPCYARRCSCGNAKRSINSNSPWMIRAKAAAGMAPASKVMLSFNARPCAMRWP